MKNEMKEKVMEDLVNIETLVNRVNINIAEMAETSRQLLTVVENGTGLEDLKVANDEFKEEINDLLIHVHLDLVDIDDLARGLLYEGEN